MLYEHVARWAVVPVGLFDVGKAALPVWLGQLWGLGLPVAIAGGLAAVAGHNWPVFLRFHGGRGLGCFLGLMLPFFPWGFPFVLAFLMVGWLLGDSAPWALAGLGTLPVFAQIVGGPTAMVAMAAGGTLLLTLIKRLEANRRPLPPPGPERRRVLARRFILDRDIVDHETWIAREPA
jgi:glycerol-3-phosphate acyltransferase PlsY